MDTKLNLEPTSPFPTHKTMFDAVHIWLRRYSNAIRMLYEEETSDNGMSLIERLESPEGFTPLIRIQQLVALGFSTDDWEEALRYAQQALHEMVVAKYVIDDWVSFGDWDCAIMDAEMERCWLRARFDINNLNEWLVDYIPGGRRTLGRYKLDEYKLENDMDEMKGAITKARDAAREEKGKAMLETDIAFEVWASL
jgi:hypothetical protein